MRYLIKSPRWIVETFGGLYYSQVKEQLPENLRYDLSNPPGFTCNGQLFVFIHNGSIIPTEFVTDKHNFN